MSSINAFIKGLDLAEINGLIDSIEFAGPAALPFALSIYNLDRVLDALKERKAELTGAGADWGKWDGGFLSPASGGIDPRTIAQRGGAVEVQPEEPEEETKEPDPRVPETRIDIQPPSVIGRGGIRQRGGGGAGADEPPLRDVDLEDPRPPEPQPQPRPEEPRIPRIIRRGGERVKDEIKKRIKSRATRAGAGVAGAAGATIWGIIKGMYPTGNIKMRPDGNIEVELPDGTKEIINPKDIEEMQNDMTGAEVNPSIGPAVGGGFGPSQFNLKKKYRNPRRGRHNYILYEAYTDKASKSTGAGAPNVKKPSLEI